MNEPQQLNMNLDLKTTTPITSEEGIPLILSEGIIFRKVSKFLTGTSDDSLVPIPIMYDIKTNKILLDMIPKEIREEYKDVGFNI